MPGTLTFSSFPRLFFACLNSAWSGAECAQCQSIKCRNSRYRWERVPSARMARVRRQFCPAKSVVQWCSAQSRDWALSAGENSRKFNPLREGLSKVTMEQSFENFCPFDLAILPCLLVENVIFDKKPIPISIGTIVRRLRPVRRWKKKNHFAKSTCYRVAKTHRMP